MRKFTLNHKITNTHILVTQYNWPIEEYLNGNALIVQINHLDDIFNIKRHYDNSVINGFIYVDKYASLETVDIKPEWADTPIIMYLNRLGRFSEVHDKLELIKRLNVTIIFTGSEQSACTDAQIVASLGIHTGISFEPNSQLNDSVLDLITYTFYSPMPHADIEPFSTIERYYDGETYVSPNLAKFVNPNRYIHVDKFYHLAFSKEDLEQDNYFGDNLELILRDTDTKLQEAIDNKEHEWQKLFIVNHPCTFCPAFRVCCGYFASYKGERCQAVMTELLEAIEFQKQKKQTNQLGICQL